MSDESKPEILKRFTFRGHEEKFYSLQDMEEFARREVAFWDITDETFGRLRQPNLQLTSTAADRQRRFMDQLNEFLTSDGDDSSRISRFVGGATWGSEHQCLVSGDSRSRVFDAYRKRNEVVAYAALAFWQGEHHTAPTTAEDWAGRFVAVSYDTDLHDWSDVDRHRIKDLGDEVYKVLEGLRSDRKGLFDQYQELVSEAKKQRGDEKTRFNEFIDGWQKESETMKELYEKQLQLTASVKLWSSRARRRMEVAILAVVAGVLILFGLVFGIWREAEYFFVVDGKWSPIPNYPAMFIIALTAVTGLLVIRSVIRVFNSSLHLQSVASEKATMAETYQALLKEDGDKASEHRGLVFASLFSPTPTGLIGKEEGANVPLAEIAKVFKQ